MPLPCLEAQELLTPQVTLAQQAALLTGRGAGNPRQVGEGGPFSSWLHPPPSTAPVPWEVPSSRSKNIGGSGTSKGEKFKTKDQSYIIN